ncbi:MAG: DUF4124 domain-containing protein [Thermodesulfobacteriota bacterium]
MKIIIKGFLRRSALSVLLPVSLVFVFGATPLYADLYKWEDSRGVLHITDDLGKVPEDKRHGVKVYKIKPAPKRHLGETPVHIQPTELVREKPPELYGGQTLQWWKDAFFKIGEEKDTLQDEIQKKAQFITVFEGGRRFGQVFGELEVSLYERYKEEIIKDEERLKDIEEKLKDLQRKATINGVPRQIRGE